LGDLRTVHVLVGLSAVDVLLGGLRAVNVLVGIGAVGALAGGLAGSNSRKVLLDFDAKTVPSFLESSNRHARIFGHGRAVNL
jgi:hypothetical protein